MLYYNNFNLSRSRDWCVVRTGWKEGVIVILRRLILPARFMCGHRARAGSGPRPATIATRFYPTLPPYSFKGGNPQRHLEVTHVCNALLCKKCICSLPLHLTGTQHIFWRRISHMMVCCSQNVDARRQTNETTQITTAHSRAQRALQWVCALIHENLSFLIPH